MTWETFMTGVAKIAHIEKENIMISTVCEAVKWSFQKKNPLPLKDETGFKTLMRQVKGIKDPDSAIIIVHLPPLANRRQSEQGHKAPATDSIDGQHDDSTMYGKKVSFGLVKLNRLMDSNFRSTSMINCCPSLMCLREHTLLAPVRLTRSVALSRSPKDGISILMPSSSKSGQMLLYVILLLVLQCPLSLTHL
jgi:hypothetical protein